MRINKLFRIYSFVKYDQNPRNPKSLQQVPTLQGCELGHVCHPAEVAPMCRAIAPRATQARGAGSMAGFPRAAASRTASHWTVAVRATKIRQLRLELSFQCRAWPTLSV